MNDNIVLEHLRHIRATVDRSAEDLRDVKFRVGQLETKVFQSEGTLMQLVHRMDRFDERLTRVEMRLGLHDAQH